MNKEKRNVPWWSWPSLLGLEAPLAAVLWAFAFSHLFHLVHQVMWTYQFLFVAVWCVCMANRLMAVFLNRPVALEDPKLFFARNNCVWLSLLLIVAVICGLWIIFFQVGYGLMGYAVFPFAASLFYLVTNWGAKGDELDSVSTSLGLFGGSIAFAFGVAIPAYFYGVPNGIYGFFFYTPIWYLTVYVYLLLLYRRKWMSGGKGGRMRDDDQQGIGLSLGILALLVFCLISASQTSRFDETWFFYALGFGCACLYLAERFLARFRRQEAAGYVMSLVLVLPAILIIMLLCWY